MKAKFIEKSFPLLALHLLLPASLAATTVTGTIKDPAGTGINGTVELELSAPGRVNDPALLLIQPKVTCAISNGAIAPNCIVRGNDTILEPAGTFYRVRILSLAGQELMKSKRYSITGATWNIATAIPLP